MKILFSPSHLSIEKGAFGITGWGYGYGAMATMYFDRWERIQIDQKNPQGCLPKT